MGLEPRQTVWAQTSAANTKKSKPDNFFLSPPFSIISVESITYVPFLPSPSPHFPPSIVTSYIFPIALTPVLGPGQMGKDSPARVGKIKMQRKAGPGAFPEPLSQAINQLLGTSESLQFRGHTSKNLCGTDRSQKSDKPGIKYKVRSGDSGKLEGTCPRSRNYSAPANCSCTGNGILLLQIF